MKKNKYLIIAVLLIFSLDVIAQKLTKEYFTTIDKLFEINLGMSPEEVSEKLGIEPFDFYQTPICYNSKRRANYCNNQCSNSYS